MTDQTDFVPPAAEGLPHGCLDSAAEGADRLSAWALAPRGRNFLAHALVQLARDGWLRAEPGDGWEPMTDRETPEPQAAPAVPAGQAPATDRDGLRDRIRRAVCEAEGFAWDSDMLEPDEYGDHADMVLGALIGSDTDLRQAIDHRDYWHGEAMAATARIIELERKLAAAPAVVSAVPGQADSETTFATQVWPLARILTEVRCGSQDWTWDEEWADLDRRHAETGYLDKLTEDIRTNGITMPVLIGTDGRLWDGHHRLRIAVRLGIGYVPVEVPAVEQPAAGAQAPCAECDHPKAAHTEREDPVSVGQCTACPPDGDTCHDYEPAAGAQQPKEARPTVAYSGKGRTFCLACPRPDDEDVPLTADDVNDWDLCPSCGRHVIDVARATQQPKEARP